jgi:hypothetical protein
MTNESRRKLRRKPAAAPARLCFDSPPAPDEELHGEMLDLSDGGAAIEILTRDRPTVDMLRRGNLAGAMTVMLPDGEQTAEMRVETVWAVEHAFGGIERFLIGVRFGDDGATRAAAGRMMDVFPEPPDDATHP